MQKNHMKMQKNNKKMKETSTNPFENAKKGESHVNIKKSTKEREKELKRPKKSKSLDVFAC